MGFSRIDQFSAGLSYHVCSLKATDSISQYEKGVRVGVSVITHTTCKRVSMCVHFCAGESLGTWVQYGHEKLCMRVCVWVHYVHMCGCTCVYVCAGMLCNESVPQPNSYTEGLTHNVRLLEGRLWGSYCDWLRS